MDENSTCNAVVKKGSKRYICSKVTGHVRRGDPHHVDDGAFPEVFSWRDSPMGGESEVVV